jgi:transglutaminase-like putative cysteine protease
LGGAGRIVNGAGAEGIDPRTVRWPSVVAARYRIEQTLRYEYDAPIRNLRHRLIIAPRRRHFDQERLASHLWTPAAGPLSLVSDAFGNDVAAVSVPRVEREIAFSLEATIVRDARRNAGATDGGDLSDPRWHAGGRLTRSDERLADAAADLRARYPNQRELAHAIARYVNGHMDYTKGVTDVFTTATVAFAQARGVCQDFAHIAIALARCAGLPARYVSGHLISRSAATTTTSRRPRASSAGAAAPCCTHGSTSSCSTSRTPPSSDAQVIPARTDDGAAVAAP